MIHWLLTKTPLMFLVQSIWRDEAFSYLVAKQPFMGILTSTAKDFNPPLYYILLHMYMWIFGHSEIMLRAFSLIFYNITIYFIYKIIVEIFGETQRFRWTYLALFIFSPFIMYYGLEARMYAMAMCFATLSWYFFLIKRPRKYLLITIGGLLTHYFFLFIVAAQFIYLLLSKRFTKAYKKGIIRQLVTAGVVFSVWILFLLSQHPPIGKAFWILPPSLYNILNIPAILLTGYEDIFAFPHFSLIPYTLVFVAILVLGIRPATRTKHERDIMLFLACWTAIPVLITLVLTPVKPLFLPRYLLVSAPGMLLLVIYLLIKIPNRVLKSILLFFLFAAFLSYHQLQIEYRKKADIRGKIREISHLAAPNDLIYVDSELNFHPVQYYFDPNRVYIIGKRYDEIPDYVGKILIPKDRIVTQPPRFPRKAFILHDDLSYDIQSIY